MNSTTRAASFGRTSTGTGRPQSWPTCSSRIMRLDPTSRFPTPRRYWKSCLRRNYSYLFREQAESLVDHERTSGRHARHGSSDHAHGGETPAAQRTYTSGLTIQGGTMYRPSICFFACLILSLAATAQLPTSTLNGTVTDPQGAAVASAKVTITHEGTGVLRETTTDAQGYYTFANLAPGLYSLNVESPSFATVELKGIRLEVGQAVTQDVKLALAGRGETVRVEVEEVRVNLTQSEVQGLVTATTIESLPLNGRNFLEEAFLIPGNRPATHFDPTKTNTLEVSSAGSFGRGGNISVDGGDNNDEVVGGTLANFPQDSVQEFQIATNKFTAEVGRSGSSIINILTKSGQNDLHGSGFIFFRQKTLQGLPATFNRANTTPPFIREQFGGSLGGAIVKDRGGRFVAS